MLSAETAGVGIGFPNQFDWIARSDNAAPDHPRHLTGAADQCLQRVGVDFEQFAAGRPIAGNLELSFADTHACAVGQLHHRHAFDGDVLAQHAGLHWHAGLRQLRNRLSVQDADLALGTPRVAVTLQPEVGHETSLRPRQLPELFLRVAVDRDQSRVHSYQW